MYLVHKKLAEFRRFLVHKFGIFSLPHYGKNLKKTINL